MIKKESFLVEGMAGSERTVSRVAGNPDGVGSSKADLKSSNLLPSHIGRGPDPI